MKPSGIFVNGAYSYFYTFPQYSITTGPSGGLGLGAPSYGNWDDDCVFCMCDLYTPS